jgi:hypothetical protein
MAEQGASKPVKTETCTNCGRTIGALEQTHVWRDSILCAACCKRQGAPLSYASAKPIPLAIGPRVCPVCGSSKNPVKKPKGNWKLCLLLLLLWILPGVLYGVFHWGYVYVCPDCGLKLGDVS